MGCLELSIEIRFFQTDGSVSWSANRGQVIYDDEGKPARMIGVSYDNRKVEV
jgi:PAS domain-containing protein